MTMTLSLPVVALEKQLKNEVEHDSLEAALAEATTELDHRKRFVSLLADHNFPLRVEQCCERDGWKQFGV
jgi:hypothetical protein